MPASRSAWLILLLFTGRNPPEAVPVLDFSGPAGSGKPFLTRTGAATLLATWFEPRGDTRFALRIAERRGGGWSEPATVAEGDNFFVNWADFPSVAAMGDGRWVVHWLERTATKSYAYHIQVSVSPDRGKTWTAPAVPHSDRSDTEHGFVALLPRPEGGADLVWLDGRQAAGGPAPMSLAFGMVDRDGRAGPDRILDARVCDCCQTALTRTSEGLLAVYRDRSEAEVRDIAVIRQVGGRWTDPVPVASDGWVYRACPVNGPSVAARGRQVAVAWYTEGSGAPRVRLARSGDAGARFGPPVTVDDGNPIGRAELELGMDGSVLAVWLERVRGAAEWRVKRFAPDGKTTGRWTLATVPATREAGFARAALLDRDLYVAWTAPSPDGGVRIHRLPIP
jgi:hypothetical protein